MKLIQLLSIIIILNSCAVIREKTLTSDYDKLVATPKSLEGTFDNVPDQFTIQKFRGQSFSDKSNYDLWNVFSSYPGKINQLKWKDCLIELEFLSDSKAEVRLLFEGEIIKKRKIRGKFKEGYFYRRPTFALVPLFPVIFGYNTSRYRIGLNENRALIIEESWDNYAFILIAGSNSKAQVLATYERR